MINKNELTKEMIERAVHCKDAEELMELAKTGSYEMTKEEAEAYMVELEDLELDEENIKTIAGGVKDPGNVVHLNHAIEGSMLNPNKFLLHQPLRVF